MSTIPQPGGSPPVPAGDDDGLAGLTPEQQEIVRRGRAFLGTLGDRPAGPEHMRRKMQSAVGPVPEDKDGEAAAGAAAEAPPPPMRAPKA